MLDFEEFFEREYPPVVRALTLVLGDRSRAEDAAQEGFSRAFTSWTRVRGMGRPSAWVYVVALRHERRRHQRFLSTRIRLEKDKLSASDPTAVAADQMLLSGLLAQLTPRQRTAVVLRFYADLTLEETASVLGCRVGTAKATLHQSMNLLRKSLYKESDVQY